MPLPQRPGQALCTALAPLCVFQLLQLEPEEAPTAALNVPDGHRAQLTRFELYFPAAQFAQAPDPAGATEPRAHSTHVDSSVAPVAAEALPAAHLLHSSISAASPQVPAGQSGHPSASEPAPGAGP